MTNDTIGLNLTTERKLLIGGGVLCLIILIGGYILVSRQDTKSQKPFIGTEVAVTGREHVPVGTKIKYNSNPPAAGPHYEEPSHAGYYDKAPADGHLVHSLEHGAIILWFNPDLSSNDKARLKNFFDKTRGKTIMVPRKNMGVPVALTSWGRILKLKTIDEKAMQNFFDTNINRAPEDAPI